VTSDQSPAGHNQYGGGGVLIAVYLHSNCPLEPALLEQLHQSSVNYVRVRVRWCVCGGACAVVRVRVRGGG
jgi:hypothetical protein